jgi:hypothetical protein
MALTPENGEAASLPPAAATIGNQYFLGSLAPFLLAEASGFLAGSLENWLGQIKCIFAKQGMTFNNFNKFFRVVAHRGHHQVTGG